MNGLCSPIVGMMIQSDELHHFSGLKPPISSNVWTFDVSLSIHILFVFHVFREDGHTIA